MSQPHGSTSGPKRRKGQRKATTSWNQFFNENGIYYSLVLAFAAALVVALIKAVEYVDLRPLGPPDFVDAPSFESALVASVGVCGPIVLELIQDASFVAVSMVSKRAVFVGKLRYFIGRSILLIGLLVPSCFLLLQMQLGNPPTPTHDPLVHTCAGVRAGAVPPRARALAPLRPARRARRACRGHGVYPRGHTAGTSMHAVSAATYQSRLFLIRTFFC